MPAQRPARTGFDCASVAHGRADRRHSRASLWAAARSCTGRRAGSPARTYGTHGGAGAGDAGLGRVRTVAKKDSASLAVRRTWRKACARLRWISGIAFCFWIGSMTVLATLGAVWAGSRHAVTHRHAPIHGQPMETELRAEGEHPHAGATGAREAERRSRAGSCCVALAGYR